jgi:hypothetical protein
MIELSVGEKLFYSTIKLTSLKDGKSVSTGTGFFFAFAKGPDTKVPTIITNKHVIDGYDEIVALFHIEKDGKPSGEIAHVIIELNEQTVIRHPDASTDLCALLIGGIMHQAQTEKKNVFYCEITSDEIPKGDDWSLFDGMEEVTMLGCPNGLSDEVNNLPIARRGITASPLSKDYNGKREFLVDMACFPGSSGSPIFVYDRNGYLDRKTNSYNMGVTRVLLVGVLYAGPIINNVGEVTLSKAPTFTISSMMHLGNAIRSTSILDLELIIKQKLKLV